MNAVSAAVTPELSPSDDIVNIIGRMADEGIPVRAIARATHVPSPGVYEVLRGAMEKGIIVSIPRDDWPANTPREDRTQLAQTPLENPDVLKHACQRFFKASPSEGALLAAIIRRVEVTKEHLHAVVEQNRPGEGGKEPTDQKIVDVMICKLRKKLKPHGIEIDTIWGFGYLMKSEHRALVTKLLLEFSAQYL